MNEDLYYGEICIQLKDIMRKRQISIYQLSKMTQLKYDVIKRYYISNICRYDDNTLIKLCYFLNCNIGDLIVYKNDKS